MPPGIWGVAAVIALPIVILIFVVWTGHKETREDTTCVLAAMQTVCLSLRSLRDEAISRSVIDDLAAAHRHTAALDAVQESLAQISAALNGMKPRSATLAPVDGLDVFAQTVPPVQLLRKVPSGEFVHHSWRPEGDVDITEALRDPVMAIRHADGRLQVTQEG